MYQGRRPGISHLRLQPLLLFYPCMLGTFQVASRMVNDHPGVRRRADTPAPRQDRPCGASFMYIFKPSRGFLLLH